MFYKLYRTISSKNHGVISRKCNRARGEIDWTHKVKGILIVPIQDSEKPDNEASVFYTRNLPASQQLTGLAELSLLYRSATISKLDNLAGDLSWPIGV